MALFRPLIGISSSSPACRLNAFQGAAAAASSLSSLQVGFAGASSWLPLIREIFLYSLANLVWWKRIGNRVICITWLTSLVNAKAHACCLHWAPDYVLCVVSSPLLRQTSASLIPSKIRQVNHRPRVEVIMRPERTRSEILQMTWRLAPLFCTHQERSRSLLA